MSGLTVHGQAELGVVRRNVLSCREIIKVGVESGANNKFKGVNNSYRERREGETVVATLSVHTPGLSLSAAPRCFMVTL